MTELGVHPEAQPSGQPSVQRSVPTTMRAAVYEQYGLPEEVVRHPVVPVPAVGADEVLVEVHAASVNALDWHYTTGEPVFARLTLGLRRPRRSIPGVDVSGTIAAVGSKVTSPASGRRGVRRRVPAAGSPSTSSAPAESMRPKPAGRSGSRRRRRSAWRPRRPSRGCATGAAWSPVSACSSTVRRVGWAASRSSWPRRSAPPT